jgi:hypothetical protein
MKQVLLAMLVLLLACVTSVLATGQANGATANQLPRLTISNSSLEMHPYDFTVATGADITKVDWPVTVVFGGFSSVNKIKDMMGSYFDTFGSSMNFFWKSASSGGAQVDQDGGRKTTFCPGAPRQPDIAVHYRIYGPPNDRFKAQGFGFFNPVTTHLDIRECWPAKNKLFGYSEFAEQLIVKYARTRKGVKSAQHDAIDMSNPEPADLQGDHYFNSNRYASWIKVR